jgi:hypothetical protein
MLLANTFLEGMGTLFCVALVAAFLCGCVKVWLIYDNIKDRLDAQQKHLEALDNKCK